MKLFASMRANFYPPIRGGGGEEGKCGGRMKPRKDPLRADSSAHQNRSVSLVTAPYSAQTQARPV